MLYISLQQVFDLKPWESWGDLSTIAYDKV